VNATNEEITRLRERIESLEKWRLARYAGYEPGEEEIRGWAGRLPKPIKLTGEALTCYLRANQPPFQWNFKKRISDDGGISYEVRLLIMPGSWSVQYARERVFADAIKKCFYGACHSISCLQYASYDDSLEFAVIEVE